MAYGALHIGDKWTWVLLREILVYGRERFEQFKEIPEGISTNILADRLKRLVAAGILTREVDPTNRRRANYQPTRKGLDLIPVLTATLRWSAAHDPESAAAHMDLSGDWAANVEAQWRARWPHVEAPQADDDV